MVRLVFKEQSSSLSGDFYNVTRINFVSQHLFSKCFLEVILVCSCLAATDNNIPSNKRWRNSFLEVFNEFIKEKIFNHLIAILLR
jgi:hypothetical protein